MHKHFKRRFEFYYQSVSVYAVALILYAVVRGTFAENEFKMVFKDPILYAFIIVLIYSVLILFFNMLFQRDIVVTDDSIIFQNRFDSKTVGLSEIEWIRVGRAKRTQMRGNFRVIKLKLKDQMRAMRINPIHFHDEHDMIETLKEFAQRSGLLIEARGRRTTRNV